MKLKGKTALITGGNSGIGLATARLFIQEGARVAITGRNRETLDAAQAELGENLLAISADLQDTASVERSVREAVAWFGNIDIIFANAGLGGPGKLGEETFEHFDAVMKTNVYGVFFTIQAAYPHLNDGGSIILNGSVLATMGWPGWSAYAATKGAVSSMTRVLAGELAPRQIRVNQVTPGAARTPVWKPLAKDADEMAALEKELIKTIPLRRMGEPEEVAKVVLFLASSDSSNVTGVEIAVDGGATGAGLAAPAHNNN